ncbi:MAG: MFS transporter [Bacteroides sp.]|nr:MFS transporter [Bacteroides sp.]
MNNPNKNQGKTLLGILIALSFSHMFNDALQSVISASYPVIKDNLSLSFAQIGLITLIYQISASVFQPMMGLYLDKRPNPWFLPIGMCFTFSGLVLLAFANYLFMVFPAVCMVGIGSSILHPEASRLTSMASGGKRGLAQSIFQVGGNFGGALGPLLAALVIAPYGQRNIALVALIAVIAIICMIPICRWYNFMIKKARLRSRNRSAVFMEQPPLPRGKTIFALAILLILIFSKYVYMASLTSYYTFFLIEKFGVTVQNSQFFLFIFLVATALGTILGGPLGDKIGRKYVIWISILGVAPFTLAMPHLGLAGTSILSFIIGLILASAFPTIVVYAQELLPNKLGLISGLFFGLAFGIAGIASAVLGGVADRHGIEFVYHICAYMPLLGLVTLCLPDINKK